MRHAIACISLQQPVTRNPHLAGQPLPPGHGRSEGSTPQLLTRMHSHSGDNTELASLGAFMLAQNGKRCRNPNACLKHCSFSLGTQGNTAYSLPLTLSIP